MHLFAGFQMRMSFSFLAEVINRFTTTYTRMVLFLLHRSTASACLNRRTRWCGRDVALLQAVRQAITGQMKDFDRTLQQLMV